MNAMTNPAPTEDPAQAITTIETIPFADLTLSDLNPRTIVSESGIEALAENIRALGLIQNLAGLRTEAGVEIVAGGRRLRALALLQDDPRFATVPVQLAPDEEIARTWASTENAHREAMHPADEIRDYGAMSGRGASVPQIAMAYGVTEAHVYRRLALSKLPAPVIDALRDGEISLGNAAAFTVGEDEKAILTVLEQVRGTGASDHRIKTSLRPQAVGHDDRRAVFVGLDAYREAGGPVTNDLFADQVLLGDADLLDDLFGKALAAAAETVKAEQGWSWVEPATGTNIGYWEIEQAKMERIYAAPGDLTDEEADRFEELGELAETEALDEDGWTEHRTLEAQAEGSFTDAQKAHAGAMVYVDRDGDLCVQGGIVRAQDKKAARDAGILASSRHGGDDGPKDPISAKLRDDLTRSTRAARQDALLDDPKLALHLLAYALSGKSGRTRVFGLRTEPVETVPSVEDGLTRDKRLAKIEAPSAHPWERPEAQDFAAFRKRGDRKVMDLLHRHLCALLDTDGTDLQAQIDKLTGLEVRKTWTPTAENFFGRVSTAYLLDLWCDLLGLNPDHPKATTFAKLKKREKAEKLADLFASEDTRSAHGLTKDQCARIAAWTPDGMV